MLETQGFKGDVGVALVLQRESPNLGKAYDALCEEMRAASLHESSDVVFDNVGSIIQKALHLSNPGDARYYARKLQRCGILTPLGEITRGRTTRYRFCPVPTTSLTDIDITATEDLEDDEKQRELDEDAQTLEPGEVVTNVDDSSTATVTDDSEGESDNTGQSDESRVVKRLQFTCPGCGEVLTVTTELRAVDVSIMTETEVVRDWRIGLREDEVALVEHARETGILDAFTVVVRTVKKDQMPRSIERFFATFFKAAIQRTLPLEFTKHYSQEFGGRISFFANQGIGMVIADGMVRCFIPQQLVLGMKVRDLRGKTKKALPPEKSVFVEWVRTRNGYVIGKGAFFDELNKRSFGAFALPGI